MKICVVTKIPSPYQIELFDAFSRLEDVSLDVIYVHAHDDERPWQAPRRWEHSHKTLYGEGAAGESETHSLIHRADLVVFGWYQDRIVTRLIEQRILSGRPLCFWGERPGFRFRSLLGRMYRRWKLRSLLKTRASVWGIGAWAVEGYKQEFGPERHYVNVPYCSNLERFQRPCSVDRQQKENRINVLYSGALIHRKGVDLLATSFNRIARKDRRVRLTVVGAGPLRPSMEKCLSLWNDRVEFHGFQQWSDLPSHYHRADLLVAPSRYDGWGLIVLEGTAAGLPVIATNRMGSAREVICHRRNGWLIDADSESAIERAMEEALALDRNEFVRMSAEASEHAQNYSLAAGVRRFRDAAATTLEFWNSRI